jgi:hypothetical protein
MNNGNTLLNLTNSSPLYADDLHEQEIFYKDLQEGVGTTFSSILPV